MTSARRSVRFSRTAQVALIPPITEMSESEINDCYYADHEFNDMQGDTVKAIRAMRRSQCADGSKRRPLNENKYCVRGLEALSSPASVERKTAKRNDVINAVLDEQERQWARGSYDYDDAIAEASIYHSEWARDTALALGMADASFVRKMIRTEQQEALMKRRTQHLASILSDTASIISGEAAPTSSSSSRTTTHQMMQSTKRQTSKTSTGGLRGTSAATIGLLALSRC